MHPLRSAARQGGRPRRPGRLNLFRLFDRVKVAVWRYMGGTWTGDKLADRAYVTLWRSPDLTRTELAAKLRVRTSSLDAALEVLHNRRLVIAREVWRVTE